MKTETPTHSLLDSRVLAPGAACAGFLGCQRPSVWGRLDPSLCKAGQRPSVSPSCRASDGSARPAPVSAGFPLFPWGLSTTGGQGKHRERQGLSDPARPRSSSRLGDLASNAPLGTPTFLPAVHPGPLRSWCLQCPPGPPELLPTKPHKLALQMRGVPTSQGRYSGSF